MDHTISYDSQNILQLQKRRGPNASHNYNLFCNGVRASGEAARRSRPGSAFPICESFCAPGAVQAPHKPHWLLPTGGPWLRHCAYAHAPGPGALNLNVPQPVVCVVVRRGHKITHLYCPHVAPGYVTALTRTRRGR